jgi:hypothetical protein
MSSHQMVQQQQQQRSAISGAATKETDIVYQYSNFKCYVSAQMHVQRGVLSA